jgi:hypothetical protein
LVITEAIVAETKFPPNWKMGLLLKNVISKCCGGHIDFDEEPKDEKDNEKESSNEAGIENNDAGNSGAKVNNNVVIESAGTIKDNSCSGNPTLAQPKEANGTSTATKIGDGAGAEGCSPPVENALGKKGLCCANEIPLIFLSDKLGY